MGDGGEYHEMISPLNIIVEDLKLMAEEEENQWKRQCIYKLPACVTDVNKSAFTPQLVSFGPYHSKNESLKPMEEHKDRALKHFLMRSGASYEQCFDSLYEIVSDLMDAYDPLDAEFRENPKAFLNLMIRDGCFTLEIIRAWQEKLPDYAPHDRIFSEHGKLYIRPQIVPDMLILENQLPMKVLYMLYQLQQMKASHAVPKEDLNKLVFHFFFPSERETRAPPSEDLYLHILDMYRKCMLGPNTKKQYINPEGGDHITRSTVKRHGQEDKKGSPVINRIQALLCLKGGKEAADDMIIRSAVELDQAGIKFRRSKSRHITDIQFMNGELRLPMISIDDLTAPLFLNLMAYERFHVRAGNHVTAYANFIDNIINDAPDIRLLHYQDIIQNGVGNDEAAARLINSMSIYVTTPDIKNSPLEQVNQDINAYCKKWFPSNRAVLFHMYFTNQWKTLSVLGAIVLFSLTITQTVYSILSYHC